MGKGDKKTKRGKIILGSHGKLRPRKKRKSTPVAALSKRKEKAKTTPAQKAKPKATKE